MLAHASFRASIEAEPVVVPAAPRPDPGPLLDALPEDQRAAVRAMQAHLLEMTTGFRTGLAASAQPDEPRVEYHPSLPLRARVQAKATELGCGPSVVWKRLRQWRAHGLAGLIDGRTVRLSNPLGGADPRLIEAILAQHAAAEVDDSTGDLARLRRRVQRRLDGLHGPGVVTVPPPSTFNRYAAAALPGRYTTGAATTRRSADNQPDKVYGVITASRPGEIVMLDTSWLDVLAYDPELDTTLSVEITIAVDVCTRSLLAWRLNPKGTKAVDAGLVIADALTPEPMRPGWPDSVRHAMLRLACQPLLSQDERFAAAAARPVIFPETIIIDHGKAFASETVKNVCRRYGITVQDARKYQPTDKPQVEAAFRTIRSQFAQHVAGYKGYSVAHRGRDVAAVARWTIEELEEFFAQYVVMVYQRRRHTGLVLPGFPQLSLSPNDAYRTAVAVAGYVAAPADAGLFLELLPIAWCTIQHYGVQHKYLRYNGKVLRKYRGMDYPFHQRHQKPETRDKWPVRIDPRDLTQAYFHDPFTDAWHTLRWNYALRGTEPFTDVTLHQVKKELAARGRDPADEQEIAAALLDLQNRTDAPEAATAAHRRARARDTERARTAARDRARADVIDADPDPPAGTRPVLRAVPTAGEDFDIDFDQVHTYDVWAGPTGGIQR
ncbi:integrase [Dactylosporangium sp. CA-139066]|uniref:integrase n=1 Tax=Dactylosporangium sp. CA-139066 TaxID=3239930 RepID=UPI003D930F9D